MDFFNIVDNDLALFYFFRFIISLRYALRMLLYKMYTKVLILLTLKEIKRQIYYEETPNIDIIM